LTRLERDDFSDLHRTNRGIYRSYLLEGAQHVATNLVIAPLHGQFDVDAIKHRLDSQPDTFEDPHGTGAYVIAGLPSSVPVLYHKRKADPSRFPNAVLVFLDPEKVLVNQEAGDQEEVRSAMEFVRWLCTQFECGIREDGFADLTDEVRKHGIDSLYAPHIRTMPLPWEGDLIRMGFFRELDHGDGSDFRLEDWITSTPGRDEEPLATYLDTGKIFRTTDDLARDMLADDPDEAPIGPLRYLTDGTYVWPSDLPYYVRRYHVRLPRAFVIHARANGFRVPEHLDVSKLTMIE